LYKLDAGRMPVLHDIEKTMGSANMGLLNSISH